MSLYIKMEPNIVAVSIDVILKEKIVACTSPFPEDTMKVCALEV
jgi:hypothetical protein